MTAILEKAFAAAIKAPPEVQNAIGQLILSELQDELRWQQAFEQTSDAQWDQLADMVRKEIAKAETDSLDTFTY
ncbi:MAG: hypothetical protein SH809_12135 [Rhodothermales bacterium]|nr:hypothetical protein [Rhodothermales bacterium]